VIQKNDPRFQKWLGQVCPDVVKSDVLYAPDWTKILEILLQIFQALQFLGCFAAASITRKVNNTLYAGFHSRLESDLKEILELATKKRKQ
jgi:uncharacterized protein involved in cysteine biosynthesis